MKAFRSLFIGLFFICFSSAISSEISDWEEYRNWNKPYFPKIHVCTVGSYPEELIQPIMYRLFDSCDRLGIDLIHLGKKEAFGGNYTKLVRMLAFLETIPDEDVVVFSDACDTFYLGNEKEILCKFLRFKSLAVFSAERLCYPTTYKDRFPLVNPSFNFLNSGGYVGYACYLRKMFKEILDNRQSHETCDQALCMKYFVDHQNEIKLDYNCEIFVTLFDVTENEFIFYYPVNRYFNKTTRSYPCIMHGNGDKGKAVFCELYRKAFESFEQAAYPVRGPKKKRTR